MLLIRDLITFNKFWPKMESSIYFLLRWKGVVVDTGREWLKIYLGMFNSYVHLGVELGNLDALEFCTPNIELFSRAKSSFEFPPLFQLQHPNENFEVIMVFLEKVKCVWFLVCCLWLFVVVFP